LHEGGFTGTVYAVHPEADTILGFPCLRSVTQATVPVDLAIVAVPAEAVLGVVNDCAQAGVRGLVVVSTGFAESGEEGRIRQRELVSAARGNGMRVVGPAALGVINTDPHVKLNASFVQTMPARGRVGFFCQSGGLGRVIIDRMMSRGLGLSTFVSAGNRSDVSGNDMLQFWSESNATDVVLLYLESLGNPRKFTRIVKRLSRTKPVVAVRSGRSSQALPLGHRVRKSSLPAAAIDSLIDQCGVIQTSSVRGLIDIAAVLALQPAPTATQVAVIATAESLSVLAVDAALAAGIDVGWSATVELPQLKVGENYETLNQVVLRADRDESVGAILVVHVPPMPSDVLALRESLLAVGPELSTPLVAVTTRNAGEVRAGRSLGHVQYAPWIGGTLPDGSAQAGSIPIFSTAEEAAVALAAVLRRAAWVARDAGSLPDIADGDLVAAQKFVDGVLAGQDSVHLTDEQASELLRFVGVSVNPEVSEGGVDCRIDVHVDELFGSVVSFGLTGDIPELLGDRAYATPPLTDIAAADLVRAPATAALLQGHAGAEPVDLRALESLLCSVAALADSISEISDLSVDVRAHAEGASVASAQVSVSSALNSSALYSSERRAM
jgi:succinyl-CoA synthetase alpha subunit